MTIRTFGVLRGGAPAGKEGSALMAALQKAMAVDTAVQIRDFFIAESLHNRGNRTTRL
jgi:hypothetical protein